MRKLTHKFIAVLLSGVMLWAMWSVGGFSVAAADKPTAEVFSAGETSYTASALGKPGLAFRFTVRMPGAECTNNWRLVLHRAQVATLTDGTCAVSRVGVLMSTLSTLQNKPEQLTLDLASTKRVDVPVQYVEDIHGNRVSFAARIENIEPKKMNRVVYARPYVVFRTAAGEYKTIYGPLCSDNPSGLHRGYGVSVPNPGWVSGSVNRSTGDAVADATGMRSRFINHANLLVRLPQGYKATAFIHTIDGYVAVDVTGDWTPLTEGLPRRALGVRFAVYRVDGAPIIDPTAVGEKIRLFAATEDGVLPLSFSSNKAVTYNVAKVTTTQNKHLTDLLPVRDGVITVRGDAHYTVFFYNQNKQFLYSDNLTRKQPLLISKEEMGEAAYYCIQAGRDATESWSTIPMLECISNVTLSLPGSKAYEKALRTQQEKAPALYRDKPENQGVQNALLNMAQLTEIVYMTKAVLPQSSKNFPAGQSHKGLPYSSTRIEGTYVPNNVSLHTFMTALQNPNSYLYSVDLGRDYGNVNGDTVYGTVCSMACAYALGIVANYTTSQWTKIPHMQTLEPGVQSLVLCDTIVGKGHVVMITDIVRDGEGRVLQCLVSEAIGSDAKSRYYTEQELSERFLVNTYAYCRYTDLAKVQHTPSEYVAVGDQQAQPVAYNTAIIPRRGDKANWYYGTDVVLDVLEKGNYTAVEVYKNEAHFNTIPLDMTNALKDGHVITQTGLPAGSYKARLTNGTDVSAWCYWVVTDATFTATLQPDGQVHIAFSATNATPLFIQWTRINDNGAFHTTELTPQQAEEGIAVVKPPSQEFKIRVAFRTEYGIVYTQMQDGITMPAPVPQ